MVEKVKLAWGWFMLQPLWKKALLVGGVLAVVALLAGVGDAPVLVRHDV